MDSPLFTPAALAATAYTAVQAITWFVLSLMGVLTSVEVLGATPQNLDKYIYLTDQLNLAIVGCYFPRNDWKELKTCCTDLLLRGNPLLALSSVYLLGSLIWGCTSVLLLLAVSDRGKNVKTLTMYWAGTTLTISLLDLIVTILFGVDYHNILYSCDPGSALQAIAVGLLMSVSARGYLLWLLNVVAASLLLRAAIKDSSVGGRSRRYSDSDSSSVYNSPADAVQDR